MRFHQAPAVYTTHVQLRTADLLRAVSFYQDILGFRILEQVPGMVKLSADGKTTLLTLVTPPDAVPKPERTTGLYHFALLLPNRSDLALFVNHLVEKGIRFGASNHLVSEAIYFDDPDGNGIEVYVDTDPSTWSWSDQEIAMDTIPLDFSNLLASAVPNQTWDGLPQSTIVGHIHLTVSELPEAKKFYTEGLGFDVVLRFRDSALFLSTAKYHHHIALNTWNGVGASRPPKNSAGLDFFTLSYPDQEMLNQALANLKALGVKIVLTDGQYAVEDPAGNGLRLTVS